MLLTQSTVLKRSNKYQYSIYKNVKVIILDFCLVIKATLFSITINKVNIV